MTPTELIDNFDLKLSWWVGINSLHIYANFKISEWQTYLLNLSSLAFF